MESSVWQLVGAAFQTAMDTPESKRAQYLSTLTEEIRGEVLALLESCEPSAALEPRSLALPEVGKTFGPYRTIELIGQGGMGAVFRAVREDGEFSQEVAIKIIGGHTFDQAAEQRFLAERQILARLQHPNIVRLLDGGIAHGQRYFVMELLRGERITSYCQSRSLGVEQILRLFLQVGNAIQYAHQNLVIHRDLKPSNILVTGDGVAKVLDFGVAKIVEPEAEASEATVQSRALTLDCASPELVRGEPVTTATDVYSLGLLLYRLLSGVNPQECGDRGLEEALRIVCDVEAPPLRKLRPELHRDLEAIVSMAMAKKPGQRYASVQQMVEDVTRYLDQLPVTARRVTAGYLVGKFVIRYRWAVAASAFVLLLAGVGAGAFVWQAKRTERERQLAEKRFQQSRRLIRSLIVDLQEKLRVIPATIAVRKSIVEDALRYLEELSADAGGRPDLLLEIAATYETLGALQGSISESSLGDFDGADRTYTKALQLVERRLAASPNDPKFVIQAAKLHTHLGFSQSKNMSAPQRHAHQVKAAALARQAQALNPTDTPSREFLATSYFYTATARIGQPDELELWNKALEYAVGLEKERPGQPLLLRSIALVHKNISGYYQRLGNPQQSFDHAGKALAIDERLLASKPGDPRTELDLAIDLNAVATALSALGRQPEAIAHLRRSVEIRAKLAARNPQDVRYQDRHAFSLFSLADALEKSDPKEALQMATAAAAIWRRLLKAGPSASFEQFLGQALRIAGAAQIALGLDGCKSLKESRGLLLATPQQARRDKNLAKQIDLVLRLTAVCK